MTKVKIAMLAAAAALSFATPSFAQNFQGFGAPNYLIDGQTQAQTQKPVALKPGKIVKHAKSAH